MQGTPSVGSMRIGRGPTVFRTDQEYVNHVLHKLSLPALPAACRILKRFGQGSWVGTIDNNYVRGSSTQIAHFGEEGSVKRVYEIVKMHLERQQVDKAAKPQATDDATMHAAPTKPANPSPPAQVPPRPKLLQPPDMFHSGRITRTLQV